MSKMGLGTVLAFDIEIASPFPEDGEWRGKGLGVSVVGLCQQDYLGNQVVSVVTPNEPPGTQPYERSMSPTAVGAVIERLMHESMRGIKVLSWNGLGFDLPFMLEEAGAAWEDDVSRLAFNHYDLAFQMFCRKGFMAGMDKTAKAMGLSGKTKGMSGEFAPPMWSGTADDEMIAKIRAAFNVMPGSRDAQEIVIEYVKQDAITTVEVVKAVAEKGVLSWITRKGTVSRWVLRSQLGASAIMPVSRCMVLPEPDQSWMTDPRSRDDYTGWMMPWLEGEEAEV